MSNTSLAAERHGAESSGLAWWPSALGIVSGIAIGAGGSAAAIILVCAAIYLLAAVTGRPGSAWIGFLASFPFIALGRVLDAPWISLAAVAGAVAVLVLIGAIRRTWSTREHRRQLLGVVVFGGVALLATVLGSALLGGAIAVLGLLAHGAWDIWHHRRRSVVSRPYAEFCAALDIVLAVVIAVTLLLGAG